MLGFDPVEDTDVIGVFAELMTGLGTERTAATLRHYATVRKLARSGRLVSEVRAEKPAEIPWVLTSLEPAGQDRAPVDLEEAIEELQLLFTESIASVSETRWTEDGVVLIDRRTRVVDAAMFGHDHRVDGFTRSPLIGRRSEDGFDLMGEQLEGRVKKTVLMARDWYMSMDLDPTIYIDVSLISVQGAQLALGRGGLRRFGSFTRDYVHFADEWDHTDDDPKLGLGRLCDRLWQAGGLSGSQLEGSGDPRG